MTLTFLELYNTCASQEWSMYDNDATKTEEMEKSLVIALNKAITEILYSYPFTFREKTHILFTLPKIKSYNMPKGLILKESNNYYSIKLNSHRLKYINNPILLKEENGIPDSFYIRGSKIVLYPTPSEKFIVTIDYLTLAVGENKNDEEIMTLKNSDDVICIPEFLEEIFKNAVISRTMLNSISAENDENFSAYKKQSEIAYKQLVKFSKGVGKEKIIKI